MRHHSSLRRPGGKAQVVESSTNVRVDHERQAHVAGQGHPRPTAGPADPPGVQGDEGAGARAEPRGRFGFRGRPRRTAEGGPLPRAGVGGDPAGGRRARGGLGRHDVARHRPPRVRRAEGAMTVVVDTSFLVAQAQARSPQPVSRGWRSRTRSRSSSASSHSWYPYVRYFFSFRAFLYAHGPYSSSSWPYHFSQSLHRSGPGSALLSAVTCPRTGPPSV